MRHTHEITNSEDILDSRDVIARIQYLESFKPEGEGEEWDEAEEYAALVALQDEAAGYSDDWKKHGVTLIRDSYFETYAREFAADIGAISGDEQWPCTCIDWEQAAAELQQDYTSVEFGDVTYWVR